MTVVAILFSAAANIDEVLKEFSRHVLVDYCPASSMAIASMLRQYIPIQLVAIRLFDMSAGRQGRATVKDADVIEP